MLIDAIADKLKGYRLFSKLLKDNTFDQFVRYVITGFVSFSVEYAAFIILHKHYSLHYITANTIVYVIIFWLNFLLNRFWSFKAKGNILRQLALYLMLFLINLVAITALMYLLSDIIGIIPQISKIMVMGAVVCWNFVLYKKVIYK